MNKKTNIQANKTQQLVRMLIKMHLNKNIYRGKKVNIHFKITHPDLL